MSLRKIVGVDGVEHPVDEAGQEKLKQAGAEWIQSHCETEEATIEAAKDADGVLFSDAPMNATVLKSLKKCKFAIRYGIGMDNIDAKAATECGIVVANVRDAFTEEVANHGLSLLMALARKLNIFDKLVKESDWTDPETRQHWGGSVVGPLPLHDQTAAVLGFGRIGKSLAKKLLALKLNVLIFDPYVKPEDVEKEGCVPATIDTIVKNSDYICCCCPLTDETRGILGEKELQIMKDTSYLVNVARGGVVDEKALIKALDNGWIKGAGLDVFESEPILNDNPLRKMDNVILTPHAGSYSVSSYKSLRDTVVEQAVQILNGEWPKYLYNTDIQDKLDIKNLWSDNSK